MHEIGLYEAQSTTRAVRRLKKDPVPQEVLERILLAATWAPSGGNAQPWRVVVARDGAVKARLGELYASEWRRFSAGYAERLAKLDAGARARQERAVRAGDYLAAHFHEAPAILVFCFRPSLLAITDAGLDRPSIVGGASVYPAVQNALLACRAEGLGCTLTTLLCFREPEVKELLAIPGDWATAAAVPVGYPMRKGHGPIDRRPVEAMAFAERWDNAWPGSPGA
jgi:nitroreductase